MSAVSDAANPSAATEHTGEPQIAGYAGTHAVSYYGNATEHADAGLRNGELEIVAIEPDPVIDFNDDGCGGFTSTGYCQLCLKRSKVYWIFCSCDTPDRHYDQESRAEVGVHKICGDCLEDPELDTCPRMEQLTGTNTA